MTKNKDIVLFWHRRDLRIKDNSGLFEALSNNENILPIFIFDKAILEKLEEKDDARVTFIYNYIEKLKTKYQEFNSDLKVYYGYVLDIFQELVSNYNIKAVYTNHDYEPYAIDRDNKIKSFLSDKNIEFKSFKDQVIFEKNEITKDNGNPYIVYTPYMKKYRSNLTNEDFKEYKTLDYINNLLNLNKDELIPLDKLGFKKSKLDFPELKLESKLVNNYGETRDIPSIRGTSRLSVHLRFGTISIRKLFRDTQKVENNLKFQNELIWRDFYMMILYHFPHIVDKSFKPQYDNIKWINDEEQFEKWMNGKTGYPIVDAGMRELNNTGYMHNRIRMVVASFLTKHLLIDWRWGERYFAQKLLDYELSSNIGGWQWAAGSGCDAAPYFRVFNPELQTKKFDPKLEYIKKWVPEIDTDKYPKPIVEHKFARERALRVYKEGLNN